MGPRGPGCSPVVPFRVVMPSWIQPRGLLRLRARSSTPETAQDEPSGSPSTCAGSRAREPFLAQREVVTLAATAPRALAPPIREYRDAIYLDHSVGRIAVG